MQASLLSNEQKLQKLRNHERKRRMDAFRVVFERYKETIGDWAIIDFKDAGPNWRETSKLNCECGRQLRYQYIVSNKNTNEVLSFGINHLKLHTGLSDEPLREVQRQLKKAEDAIEEMKKRIEENWELNMDIPEEVIVPEEVRYLLDEGLPLSSSEEKIISRLVQDVRRKQWESAHRFTNRSVTKKKDMGITAKESLRRNRATDAAKQFELHEDEKVFVDEMIQSGVGSAMTIAKQLHESFMYKERYTTGRVKVYPLVVMYLERQVEEEKLTLIFNHGFEDRVYQLVK